MRKEREFKVIVVNPLTEQQKSEMLKRVEDYLTTVYTQVEGHKITKEEGG